MDYTAILEALDARTQTAFQAWAENTLADFAKALGERDARILVLETDLQAANTALASANKDIGQLHGLTVDTQKQVREAVDEAIKAMAVPVYRGVFDRDAEYNAGHMVTHKGSIWHCNALVNGEAPGTCDAWTLAVKCGRDGKDAKDIKPEAAE